MSGGKSQATGRSGVHPDERRPAAGCREDWHPAHTSSGTCWEVQRGLVGGRGRRPSPHGSQRLAWPQGQEEEYCALVVYLQAGSLDSFLVPTVLSGFELGTKSPCASWASVPASRTARLLECALSQQVELLWGPVWRHTSVPRLPGCPPPCLPVQRNRALGTAWATQRRALENRPCRIGRKHSCVEASGRGLWLIAFDMRGRLRLTS